MRRFLPLLTLLAGVAACMGGLPSCGGGDTTRPVVLGTIPPAGSVLDNVVNEFVVVYDAPVHILNRDQVTGLDRRGEVPMTAFEDRVHPNWLRVRPSSTTLLLPGAFGLRLGAGLEVNGDDQYRLEDVEFGYTFGRGSNLFLGSRGRSAVVEVDPDTFAEFDAVATPAGRVPLGLRGTQVGTDVRLWVQTDEGGGTGHSLAWYTLGDAAMTEIPLTTGGGDLVATHRAIALGRDGVHLFVAYRDEALGRVRLSEIDVTTATESRTLVLSPPSSAGTEPLGLATSPLGLDVLVACRTDGGDVLCAVSVDDFTERNLGPVAGLDGYPLDQGAGAVATWGQLALVAGEEQPTGSVSAIKWQPPPEFVGHSPSQVTGMPQDLLSTPDGLWLVTALAGYDGDLGLVRRTLSFFYDPAAVSVATTTSGANPAATAVRALVPYRTQARFLTLFDNDAVARWGWSPTELVQEDADAGLDGVQAVDVTLVAPDAVSGTFVSGYYPP
jgi:hypothetical protein